MFGVADLGDGARLVEEARDHLLVRASSGWRTLIATRLPMTGCAREEDVAHRARADLLQDLVVAYRRAGLDHGPIIAP